MFKKQPICYKFLRTHLCRSQFPEHRPHCHPEELLKSVASKNCQLVDRRVNNIAFNFHCSRLKVRVLPRLLVEKCIHCLLTRNTLQFYALQPRWWWFRGCIRSLDSGVISHTRCLPISQEIMVTPSGRLPSVR